MQVHFVDGRNESESPIAQFLNVMPLLNACDPRNL
jgi:hypothetical protein